jgi:hypothetical protein
LVEGAKSMGMWAWTWTWTWTWTMRRINVDHRGRLTVVGLEGCDFHCASLAIEGQIYGPAGSLIFEA